MTNIPGTNVPAVTFGPNGFIAPLESAILAGVTQDINAAFGGGLNPDLTTPQGQLATTEAALVGNVNDTFLFFTTQTDPAYAVGRMQDAIARIYFLERLPSQSTVLQIQCNGLQGVNIPVNSLIQDGEGNTYTATDAGTIPASGNITIPFANLLSGPIAIPGTGDVIIYRAIPGWDSVICLSGVLGNNVETPSQFEARRSASVAKNAAGSLSAVLGAVLSVSGVIDAYAAENDTSSIVTRLGVNLNPNSLYVAVVGGDATAVAMAIWTKKMPGCAYTGNTTVAISDPNPAYNPPAPTYNVVFERPASLALVFAISMVNSAAVPADGVTQVQNAVINAFAGLDGGSRARIGSLLLASRFYAPIAALGAWASTISILLGSNNAPDCSFTGSISGANLTVSAISAGALAPGQTISDATGNLIVGTQIVSQTSGTTGSTGVYVVTNSQTVLSELMQAVTPALYEVQVSINQEPVTAASLISVTFL